MCWQVNRLLAEFVAQRSAWAIEDALKAEIVGWKKSIEQLENQVKEHSQRAEIAKKVGDG